MFLKIHIFSVRINVIGYDDESKTDPFYPAWKSESDDVEALTVNVLLIGNQTTTHFVLVKSLSALLRKPGSTNMKHFCFRLIFKLKFIILFIKIN